MKNRGIFVILALILILAGMFTVFSVKKKDHKTSDKSNTTSSKGEVTTSDQLEADEILIPENFVTRFSKDQTGSEGYLQSLIDRGYCKTGRTKDNQVIVKLNQTEIDEAVKKIDEDLQGSIAKYNTVEEKYKVIINGNEVSFYCDEKHVSPQWSDPMVTDMMAIVEEMALKQLYENRNGNWNVKIIYLNCNNDIRLLEVNLPEGEWSNPYKEIFKSYATEDQTRPTKKIVYPHSMYEYFKINPKDDLDFANGNALCNNGKVDEDGNLILYMTDDQIERSKLHMEYRFNENNKKIEHLGYSVVCDMNTHSVNVICNGDIVESLFAEISTTGMLRVIDDQILSGNTDWKMNYKITNSATGKIILNIDGPENELIIPEGIWDS